MSSNRQILSRHQGLRHGPIQRVIDPGALGEQLKPFIFLDYFNAPVSRGWGFGMHPHSGLATLTWQPDCDIRYEDTTGQSGVLKAGGLEWMNAGGGAWHQGHFETDGHACGFQLWVPMPPSVEDGEAQGQYVAPEQVPILAIAGGQVRVLLGAVHGGGRSAQSAIHSFQDMTYAVVELQPGQSWTWQPAAHHSVAFAFPFDGDVSVLGQSAHETLLVLSAQGDVPIAAGQHSGRVLIGSAVAHAHPLVLGSSSVHTNPTSLRKGIARIRAIGADLQRAGRLG